MSTLVVMAAGIGSRYGGGIKQLEPVGPSGEIIVDYSIYDAIEAGFRKVVFIIRKDIEEDFKEIIGHRIEKYIQVEYVFQEIEDLPEGYQIPEGRVKPWGTGQAILSCLDKVLEPFAVINADDYYGKDSFRQLYHYLEEIKVKEDIFHFAMVGFQLDHTLSENGAVTRGICRLDSQGELLGVDETRGIFKKTEGPVVIDDQGKEVLLDGKSLVSMNMWGFTPDFIKELKIRFQKFLDTEGNQLISEFLVPIIVDELIREGRAKVDVLSTKDIWFGVTYKEDKEFVIEAFQQLINEGIYPQKLFQ